MYNFYIYLTEQNLSCLITRSQSECPICKKSLNKDSDVFPDNFTKRELCELKIHAECPNAGYGCSVRVLSSDLEEHAKICLFTSSTNENGKIVCSFVNIGCKKEFATFQERQTHLKQCVQDHFNVNFFLN